MIWVKPLLSATATVGILYFLLWVARALGRFVGDNGSRALLELRPTLPRRGDRKPRVLYRGGHTISPERANYRAPQISQPTQPLDPRRIQQLLGDNHDGPRRRP